MLTTSIFGFKKPELTDSPPDITVMNDNYDKIETELHPTVNDTLIPTGDTYKVSEFVGFLANRIKVITGKSNWYDNPSKTLEDLNTHITSHPHDTTKADKTYVDTELAKKLDDTQIKNNLTETTAGNVLDASQGKILDDKITVLNDDRGYLTSKKVRNDDFNNIKDNGKYAMYLCSNAPIANTNILLNVTGWDDSDSEYYIAQEAIILYAPNNSDVGRKFKRLFIKASNVWTPWEDKIGNLSQRNYIPIPSNYTYEDRLKPTKPSDYINMFKLNGLKTRVSLGIDGDGYGHAIGINAWNDNTGGTYELIFSHDGTYVRSNSGDTWLAPQKLATTDKIEISCTPQAGYTITSQKNYKNGILTFINLEIKKTDNSDFAIGTNTPVGALPVSFDKNYTSLSAIGIASTGQSNLAVNSFIRNNGSLEICAIGSGIKNITISGVVL